MGQRCILCCLNRRLVGVEPVAIYYQIQSLECPSCRSVVRLVQRRVRPTKKSRHRASAGVAAPPYFTSFS